MRLKILGLICLIMFSLVNIGFCLPWEKLHEQADNLSMDKAKIELQDHPDDLNYLSGIEKILVDIDKRNSLPEVMLNDSI
jgi:hypothetical protein